MALGFVCLDINIQVQRIPQEFIHMPLQLRRGTEAELAAITPVEGELIYIKPDNDNPSPRLAIGDGTSVGGTLVSGYSDPEAKDAVAEAFAGGTHTAISFSYNSGAKTISASVNLGDYTGTLKASAFKGTLVADDSSILVDAVSGRIVGDVHSDIYTDSISAGVGGTVVVEDNLQVLGTAIFDQEAIFKTNDYSNRILTVSQHHNDPVNSSSITLRRSRGTYDSAEIVQSGDIAGSFVATAKIANTYTPISAIISKVGGVVTDTAAPGILEFSTANAAGVLSTRMTIDNNGVTTFTGGRIIVPTNLYDSNIPFTTFTQHHATVDARSITFARSRGTEDAPLAVNNNDDISDLRFAAYDGFQYVSSCGISAIADAAPNLSNGLNSVPGRLEFLTTTSAGSATRVRIDSSGLLEALFGLNVTGRVDFITDQQSTVGAAGTASVLPARPSTYFKVKVNGVEYVVPAYAII